MLKVAESKAKSQGNLALIRTKHAGKQCKPKTSIVELTPDMARGLLGNNPDNRNISPRTVSKFAEDILNDRWQMNGETIIVADTGELNDGQHRCHAVVLADKPIHTAIITGVPRAARFSTDMGTARTTGNILSMSGVSNSNNIARVAALLHQVERWGEVRKSAGGRGSTKQEIVDFAHAHMDELLFGFSFVTGGSARKLGPVGSIACAAVIIARYADEDGVRDFFESLVSGENLTKTNPIFVARERLISEQLNKTLTPHKAMEMIFRSWNAWRSSRRLNRIAIMGEWPEIKG